MKNNKILFVIMIICLLISFFLFPLNVLASKIGPSGKRVAGLKDERVVMSYVSDIRYSASNGSGKTYYGCIYDEDANGSIINRYDLKISDARGHGDIDFGFDDDRATIYYDSDDEDDNVEFRLQILENGQPVEWQGLLTITDSDNSHEGWDVPTSAIQRSIICNWPMVMRQNRHHSGYTFVSLASGEEQDGDSDYEELVECAASLEVVIPVEGIVCYAYTGECGHTDITASGMLGMIKNLGYDVWTEHRIYTDNSHYSVYTRKKDILMYDNAVYSPSLLGTDICPDNKYIRPAQQSVRVSRANRGQTVVIYEYKPRSYDVTYNGNGATGGSTASQKKEHNVNLTLRNNGFSRTGYSFVRWNTNTSNTGTAYNQGSVYTGNNNLTLYAIWTGNKYRNTLNYNGNKPSNAPTNVGNVPGAQSKDVIYPNTAASFSVAGGAALTGFTFNGWYTAASGGSKLGSTYTVGSNSHVGNQSATVYAHWTANKYTNTLKYNANIGNGVLRKAAPGAQTATVTYPNTAATFNVSTQKPERKGYTFAGWYTAANGGTKVGTTFTVGAKNYAGNQSATLYAHWTPNKYKVTYDKNATNAVLHGTPTVDVYFDSAVDVGTANHSATRSGWNFMGWHRDPASTVVYSNYILQDDFNITMYAIYKRSITLLFAEDKVTDNSSEAASKSFSKTIYTKNDTFNFNDAAVTTASTRTKGTYTAVFKNNGVSHIIDEGGVDASDGRQISTGLRADNTILATRYFVGWSEQMQRTGSGVSHFNLEALSDYDGTIIGSSGTTISIKTNDLPSTYQNYATTGNRNSVSIHSINEVVPVYPQYTRTYIKLPDATRNEGNVDNPGDKPDGNVPDKFIGWFTKPQPENGKQGDGGVYYGGPGDVVRLDGDVVLYPWFNIAPTIVHSAIADGFYEGQPLSYEQLMTLVDASDVDNPKPVGPEGLVMYDGTEAWIDLYNLNAESFLRNELKLNDADISRIMSQVNVSQFVPELVSATFYCDGKDKYGNNYSDSVTRTQTASDIKSRGIKGLDTSKTNVGKLDLLYQITDNGIYDGLVKILISNGYHIDSPITVQYVLETDIKFNHNPTLDLKSTAVYNIDTVLNSSNIVRFILDKQKTNDKCDDTTNLPWWAAEEDEYAANDKTKADLYGTLKIVDVYEIKFSSRYESEHQAACDAAKNIHKLSDLWKLKETDPETFQHITSYKVEFDCMDQWGKTASGLIYSDSEKWDSDHPELDGPYGVVPSDDPDAPKKYGQTKEERSIIIVPFNNYDDLDLLLANSIVSEKLRYIDFYWSTKLNTNEFWGESGASVLQHTFQKYIERNSLTPNVYAGSVEVNGDDIDMIVNDYCDD